METKKCSKCKTVKSISEFHKRKTNKDWLHSYCKKCENQRLRQSRRNNPEKHNAGSRKWAKNNRKYFKQRLRNNPQLRLSARISSAIRNSLKGNKNNHWEHLVDFTLQDLIKHIESLFKEGMTWQNYGKWHIDHIIPKSLFSFTSYNDPEFKQCWALENLQPLWAFDNISKGNKYTKSIRYYDYLINTNKVTFKRFLD